MKKDILIHIKSAFDAAGINATEEQLSRLAPKLAEINQKAKAAGDGVVASFSPAKLVFSALHGNLQEVGQQILGLVTKLKGVTLSFAAFSGIAAVISLVAVGVKKLSDHFKKVREESEATAKAQKDAMDAALKAGDAIKEAYSKTAKSIDDLAKRKKDDISLTRDQTKAELELAAARAKAAGKDKEAAALTERAKAVEKKAAVDIENISVDAAQKKLDAAKKQASGMFGWKNGEFSFDPKEWEKRRRLINGQIMRLRNEIRDAQSVTGTVQVSGGAIAIQQKAPQKVADLERDLKMTEAAKVNLMEQMTKAKAAAENIAEAKRVLDMAKTRTQISVTTETTAKVEAVAKVKNEELKAEEEVHKKRMENFKKLLSTRTSSADSFVSDFQAGGAGVAAERKRIEDVDKMKKIADSFKWAGTTRNLVNALNAGDTEAYQRELEWNRKYRGRSFNPNVEAAIRGVAEMRATNTTEDLLRQVANGVEGLRGDVKDLLSMK